MASGDTLAVFTPYQNEPPATLYALADLRNGHPILAFDDTTLWNAIFSSIMPRNYAGGGITVYVHWMAASAITGTIGFGVEIERMDDGTTDYDADSFATLQAITNTTVPGTTGIAAVTSVAITSGANMDSLAAGEMFRLRLSRTAADTSVGNAQVLAVEIKET